MEKIADAFNVPPNNLSVAYLYPDVYELTFLISDKGMADFRELFRGRFCKVLVTHDGDQRPFMSSQDSVYECKVNPLPTSGSSQPTLLHSRVWDNNLVGVGQHFKDQVEVRKALKQLSIAKNFSFKYLKNTKRRVMASCRVEGCQWKVNVSLEQASGLFVVNEYEKLHTCAGGVRKKYHPHASQNLVSELISSKIKDTPSYSISELVKDLRNDYEHLISEGMAF